MIYREGLILLVICSAHSAWAGMADVLDVQTSCTENRVCRFDVTVRHTDEGWKHFADRWEVLTLDGKVLATRELAHPHVNEQPFTRSLFNVHIPPNTKHIRVRSHDSVHGFGGKELVVDLP